MPPKRLLVFSDGTTIRQLANQVGVVDFAAPPNNSPALVHPIIPYNPNVTAGYQEGVGTNRTFFEYLWDGATAAYIDEECTGLYKYIVQHYTDDHEIFLFGYSRGAFIVRCVAGMINNCGILKRSAIQRSEELDALCQEVYRTYRSPLAVDRPQSERCRRLRSNSTSVWQVKRPIRFMGLIDTVGALGIPRFNAGVGFGFQEYEFRDLKISSVVQVVYHAISLHERAWMLQPCFAFPGDGEDKAEIKQCWFPGMHHDIGRSTFRFVRERPWNTVERLLGAIPSFLTRTEWPNEVCADVATRWLLQGIKDVEAPIDANFTFPGIDYEIRRLSLRISSPEPPLLGTGDVSSTFTRAPPTAPSSSFDIICSFKRLVSVPFMLLDYVSPRFDTNITHSRSISVITGIVQGTTDRRIPRATDDEGVYPYMNEESVYDDLGREMKFTVKQTAVLDRYVSQTYETFLVRRRTFGW